MKTIRRYFERLLIFSAIFAIPQMASAGTTFTQTVTPASDSAVQGTAANLSYPSGIKATASGTYTGGLITLSSSVAYANGASATPGIAVVFPNNPYGITSGSLNSTAGLTVTTTSGTLAGTYTVTIVGINTSSKGATNTYALTVGALGATGPGIVWTPAGVNTNWSTAGNWTPNNLPGSTNDVEFYDTGAADTAGIVDNVVGSNFTVGSLAYGNTNGFHTTLIASGQTLTLVDPNGLSVGTGTDIGNSLVTDATITGTGGAVVVSNLNANVTVSQSSPSSSPSAAEAELDMSGLNTFKATVSRLLVGVDSDLKGANGILNLARTNVITMTAGSVLPQIDIGESSQASADTSDGKNTLLLGQTNAFFVDSIAVGRGRVESATMLFNNAFNSPTAYFRGTNGNNSRVGTWTIGDGFNGKVAQCYGTNDFSLGTVDAMVNVMNVGLGSSATGSTTTPGYGTLDVNAGTINVNTLNIGLTSTGAGIGLVNLTGGSLVVNSNLVLASGGVSASGTLNISGVSTVVTANNGIAAGSGSATINMTAGGALTVTNSSATIGTTASPLNTFSIANSTLNLAVQSTTPNIAIASLAANGAANTINISSVPLLTGFPAQFPIIQYGLNGGVSSGDLTTFVLGTLPSASPAYGAYISNNVANNSIDIVFTSGPFVPALAWDGALSGNWDTTTANWKPKSGPDTTYGNGNFATFDDTLTGTANVNLTASLTPGSLAVNNTASNYVFSGVGGISGATALVKSGSGVLKLAETGGDNFSGGVIVNNGTVILDDASSAISGGTTINGGTIQIGNNDANGALPAGNVTDSGALVFNRANNIIVANAISGAGTLTQNGTNIVTMSGNSTFTGAATVAQGTLQIGSTNGLGLAASVTVINGATFDVDGTALFGNGNSGLTVTVSGAGVGGGGAIINSGASQTKVLHTVTLAADATFGGTGDWDIRNSTGNSSPADAQLNGAFNLTKVGTNSISFRGVTVDPGLGNINVQAGSLTFTATASAPINSLGDSSATLTVFTNATLTLDTIGNIPAKNFALINSGTLKCSSTNTLGSPVALTGPANNTISVGSGSQFTITGVIGGAGGFSKNGSGTLFLTANNNYGGNTVVSGGTLALYLQGGGSDGSIASTNININSGSTIDVSGRSDGTLTLAAGQTLLGGVGTNGPGTINGILVVSAGANIATGSGSTNIGVLNVTSNLTLQGAATIKISAAGGNGQIDAAGIAYGGTLTVTNFSGTVTNGQAFQLFVATNGIYNAGTFSSVTLPVATGLTWTNNLAVNGTIVAGVVSAGPPAQPQITSVSLSGTNLVISGTNGTAGLQFEVLTSTNVALALANWTSITTNNFGSANFSVTNTVNSSAPQNFFILRVP